MLSALAQGHDSAERAADATDTATAGLGDEDEDEEDNTAEILGGDELTELDLAKFTPAQMKRYEAYRNSYFPKAKVARVRSRSLSTFRSHECFV